MSATFPAKAPGDWVAFIATEEGGVMKLVAPWDRECAIFRIVTEEDRGAMLRIATEEDGGAMLQIAMGEDGGGSWKA
jgi:hypothetical protein